MRKQYHFKHVGEDVLIFDVGKLVKLSEALPVIEVELSNISEFDENFWYQSKGDEPTCKSICDHYKLVEAASLDFPILLNADGTLMDGMHRVCKAYLKGMKMIKAKRFTTQLSHDFENKHPDELPYE